MKKEYKFVLISSAAIAYNPLRFDAELRKILKINKIIGIEIIPEKEKLGYLIKITIIPIKKRI
jgi:hypothetical protein